MSKRSKDKGDRGERILAKKFSKWWGTDFTRTPSSGGFRTAKFREEWNAAGDLVTPDDSFPFCVESKNAEKWEFIQIFTAPKGPLVQWWRQTVEETPDSKIPFLVVTRNRVPHFFIMRYDEWLGADPPMLAWLDGDRVVIGLLDWFFETFEPDFWRSYDIERDEKAGEEECSAPEV